MMKFTTILLLLATLVALSASIPTFSRFANAVDKIKDKIEKGVKGAKGKGSNTDGIMSAFNKVKGNDFDTFGMMCDFMDDKCQEYTWEVEQPAGDQQQTSVYQTGYILEKFQQKMAHVHTDGGDGEGNDVHTFINLETMTGVIKPTKYGPCYLTKFEQDSSVQENMKKWEEAKTMQISKQVTLDGSGDKLSREDIMEELKEEEAFMKMCMMGGVVKTAPVAGDQVNVEDGQKMLNLLSYNVKINLLVQEDTLKPKNPFMEMMNKWRPRSKNGGKSDDDDDDDSSEKEKDDWKNMMMPGMFGKYLDMFGSYGDEHDDEKRQQIMSEMFDEVKNIVMNNGGDDDSFEIDVFGMMCDFMGDDKCQEFYWKVDQGEDDQDKSVIQSGYVIEQFNQTMAIVNTEREEGPDEHTCINVDSMMAIVKPTEYGPCFLTKFKEGLSVESNMRKWNATSMELNEEMVLDGTSDKLTMKEMREVLQKEPAFKKMCFMNGVVKAVLMTDNNENGDVKEGNQMLQLLSYNTQIKLLVRKEYIKDKSPMEEMMKKWRSKAKNEVSDADAWITDKWVDKVRRNKDDESEDDDDDDDHNDSGENNPWWNKFTGRKSSKTNNNVESTSTSTENKKQSWWSKFTRKSNKDDSNENKDDNKSGSSGSSGSRKASNNQINVRNIISNSLRNTLSGVADRAKELAANRNKADDMKNKNSNNNKPKLFGFNFSFPKLFNKNKEASGDNKSSSEINNVKKEKNPPKEQPKWIQPTINFNDIFRNIRKSVEKKVDETKKNKPKFSFSNMFKKFG